MQLDRIQFAIILIMGGLALGLSCNSQKETEYEVDWRRVQATVNKYLTPLVDSRNFSGAILLAKGDDVIFESGFGMANHEHTVPITADTKFQIASISKSFTAAAVTLLQEDGRLEWSDRISEFIPEFPHGNEITIRHLLAHTSGIARYVFQPDYAERSQQPHSTLELVDWIKNVPLTSAPGTRYGYSNANYSLLAHVIEQVTDLSYGDFLQNRIFGPLNLTQTGHRGEAGAVVSNLASGYTPVGLVSLQRSSYHDYSTNTGSGSIYSTTGDVFKWFKAQSEGQLFGQVTRDELLKEVGTSLGYGWNLEDRLNREALVMRGWDGVGFACRLVHYYQENLTLIVLSNLNMSSVVDDIADNVSSIALGEDYTPFQVLVKPNESAAELKELEGVYRFGTDFFVPGAAMTIVESDGQLLLPGDTPRSLGGLLPIATNSFIHRQQGFHVTFEKNKEGRVSGMIYGRFRAEKELEE